MDSAEDDAWGDFKSTPEQAETAPAMGLHEPTAATAAAATIVPPPPVEQIPPHTHQAAATTAADIGSESVAAGRGDDGIAADLLGSLPDPMFSGSGGSFAVAGGGEDLFASIPAVAAAITLDTASTGDSSDSAGAAAGGQLLHEGGSAEAR
ncbi:unnamed protein product, partial [Ectocarpus fasciculatus]